MRERAGTGIGAGGAGTGAGAGGGASEAFSPKTIFVRGGVYYFKEELTLTPDDNGLTIAAYKDEPAILSGGVELLVYGLNLLCILSSALPLSLSPSPPPPRLLSFTC